MYLEKAKNKWKPIFDASVKKYPNIDETKFVIICEKISPRTEYSFDFYYDKYNPDWELARMRLKEAPNLLLMIQISCEIGILDYEAAYNNYLEFVDILDIEKFFSYKSIENDIIGYIRKLKLQKLCKI